jgi:hypothetical protein
LLSLPGELRNRIYEFAIGGNDISITRVVLLKPGPFTPRAARSGNDEDYTTARWGDLFALARTCRHLHEETHLLPFRLNTFIVTIGGETGPHLADLKSIQKQSITTIALMSKYSLGSTEDIIPRDLIECTGLKRVIARDLLYTGHRDMVRTFATDRNLELVVEVFSHYSDPVFDFMSEDDWIDEKLEHNKYGSWL